MALTYYNNWRQQKEFIWIHFEVKIDDGIFIWTAGVLGVGFVFAVRLPQ